MIEDGAGRAAWHAGIDLLVGRLGVGDRHRRAPRALHNEPRRLEDRFRVTGAQGTMAIMGRDLRCWTVEQSYS